MPVATSERSTDGRTGRRERNAARLFDAACELMSERGFHDLTIDEICDRAGVGRATFFRIYDTKAGLLRELNRRLAADATRRLDDAGAGDALESLHRVRAAIVDAWRDPASGQVAMTVEFVQGRGILEPHAAHPELLAVVERIVADGMARGELVDTVPVDLAASLALVQLIAPIGSVVSGHDVDIDELSKVLLEQWYRGMANDRSPRALREKERQ